MFCIVADHTGGGPQACTVVFQMTLPRSGVALAPVEAATASLERQSSTLRHIYGVADQSRPRLKRFKVPGMMFQHALRVRY